MIRFRDATINDADLLLSWRNDPATVSASLVQGAVDPDDHIAWLTASLASEARELRIALADQMPIGTVRLDLTDDPDVWELSWTIAPEARGRGLGKEMVTAAAGLAQRPLIAHIRLDNAGSEKIAQAAGFRLESSIDGIGLWRRD